MRLLRCLRVGVRKKTGPAKPPAMFFVSISVIHKEYITHQYTSMYRADVHNFAAYMDTESTKVNNWSQKKRLWLTRKSGTATISCDFKSSQLLNTVIDGKVVEGIAVACVNEGKKDVRTGTEAVHHLKEDLIQENSDVMLIAEKTREVRLDGLIITALISPENTASLLLNQAQERSGLGGTNIPALIRH